MFLLKNNISYYLYKKIAKPVFFLFDTESVHISITSLGEVLGVIPLTRFLLRHWFSYKNTILSQKIKGILFSNPVGLSAGFDYEARLTQILPSIGFGFETIGTITNMPYGGNKLHA